MIIISNLHSGTKLSGWLRHCLNATSFMCITRTITYASVRLFIRNLNTSSSHFVINKNNTVWHAVSLRFEPDKVLTSSVLLERSALS